MGDTMNTGLLEQFCAAVNAVKKSGYSRDTVGEDNHLGGDLGIDSIEMLEIPRRLRRHRRPGQRRRRQFRQPHRAAVAEAIASPPPPRPVNGHII